MLVRYGQVDEVSKLLVGLQSWRPFTDFMGVLGAFVPGKRKLSVLKAAFPRFIHPGVRLTGMPLTCCCPRDVTSLNSVMCPLFLERAFSKLREDFTDSTS